MCALDRLLFAQLCDVWAQFREASEQLERDGLTYETARGSVVAHPLVKISADYAKAYLSLAKEFGLTPLSRQRMNIVTIPEQDDDEESYFGRLYPEVGERRGEIEDFLARRPRRIPERDTVS